MDRAHMVSPPLPKNATEIRIIQREWGIERKIKQALARGTTCLLEEEYLQLIRSGRDESGG